MNKIFILIIALGAIVSRAEAGEPNEAVFMANCIAAETLKWVNRTNSASIARNNCAGKFAYEKQMAEDIAKMWPAKKECYDSCINKKGAYHGYCYNVVCADQDRINMSPAKKVCYDNCMKAEGRHHFQCYWQDCKAVDAEDLKDINTGSACYQNCMKSGLYSSGTCNGRCKTSK